LITLEKQEKFNERCRADALERKLKETHDLEKKFG
jgi:hypothetical protein